MANCEKQTSLTQYEYSLDGIKVEFYEQV